MSFEPRSEIVVSEFCLIADKSPKDIVSGNVAIFLYDQFDYDRPTIFALAKRCKIGRKFFRQDREDLAFGVNRHGIHIRVLVNC